MLLALFVAWVASYPLPDAYEAALGGIAVATWIVGSIVFRHGARCPRCNGNVGGHAPYLRLLRVRGLQPATFCPFCGVSLDAPIHGNGDDRR